MENNQIKPDKITKPIQLLAAWLIGLIFVNASFLGTAASINNPTWISGALVVASMINVPLFLGCIFLLQTKFRPEMQEDSYYSKYLESNTAKLITINPIESSIHQLRNEIADFQNSQLEIIMNVDHSLKSLASKITTSVTQEDIDSDAKAELQEIAQEIELSSKILESVVEQTYSYADIQINDLLPEYQLIRKELVKNKLPIGRSFGSSSKDPEIPRYKIIGFGENVPIEQLRRVISICQKYGFDQINYSEHELSEDNIYIGSYIYSFPEYPQAVPITSSLLNTLNASDSDIYDVINEIKRGRGETCY